VRLRVRFWGGGDGIVWMVVCNFTNMGVPKFECLVLVIVCGGGVGMWFS
jgi:hypothetical protein